MQSYKIRIPDPETSRRVQEKAFELGYKWHSGRNIISTDRPCLWMNNSSYICWSDLRYFNDPYNDRDIPEISWQDFLAIGEEKKIEELQNTKTNNMSEAKLKCTKEPKKAKNLTVGNEYDGIFVSKDGDQVDSFKEADYFLCTNNCGNEARYSISLFEEVVIVPPVPPIMPFAEYSNGEKLRTQIGNGVVRLHIADPRSVDETQCDNSLGYAGVNISCGISQIHGIQGTFVSIKENLRSIAEEYYDGNVSEEELDTVTGDLLVAAIKRTLQQLNTRFGLVSTNEDTPGVVAQLTRYSETTTSGVNDNSRNTIHVFVINKD